MAALSLTPELLISAYAQGYFPMGQEDSDEILWFNPDPRAILPLEKFHLSRSMTKELNGQWFEVTFDENFLDVISLCAERDETWITPAISSAYHDLHKLGFAHSVEIWDEKNLVGGVYGVTLGGGFFAESMFHRRTNGSKLALHFLVNRLKARGFQLLEVQFLTSHLKSLGAVEISKKEYLERVDRAIRLPVTF